MAYSSWSVVFGEQPSAAKWNILGTNDASFNDGTGIGNNVINSAQLKAAVTGTGSSGGDFGVGPTTCVSISISAGTWFLVGKGYAVFSVAQDTSVTMEIRNSTDSTTLDSVVCQAEYVSGTLIACVPFSNTTVVTVAGTKTIILRCSASTGSGSTAVNDCVLTAIPVGV